MKTKKCTDCMSYEPCAYWGNMLDPINGGVTCSMFKDKSKFLELPCAIGETVYMIIRRFDDFDGCEYYTVIQAWFRLDLLNKIGETVFLTEEEAQKKLEELNG